MTKHHQTEKDLIDACISQDSQAQFELFERYKVAMFNLVFRICNDYDGANDLLQEGFIAVFRHIKNFRQESSLGAWIKTIMVRKALKGIKSKVEYLELNEQLESEELFLNQWIDAEMLDQAIRSLPESSRAVFVLYEVEGYNHEEISQLLTISKGTSKSQLHYAKKLLQSKLSTNYLSK
jgi:RNA polymerase sigma factor (sigma-70 family)